MRTYIEKLGKEYIEGRKEVASLPCGLDYTESVCAPCHGSAPDFSPIKRTLPPSTAKVKFCMLRPKNIHKPLPGKCGIWNGSQVATAFISYLPNALKPMQISLKDSIIHTKVKNLIEYYLFS